MRMHATEQMIDAAHRQLPGISNRERIRHALNAALDLAPDPNEPPEIPLTPRIRFQIDEDQLRADFADFIAQQQATAEGRILFLPHVCDEPRVTVDGLEGPGVTDATGQTPITVTEPQLHPALAGPLELGTAADLRRRLNVAASTVSGWVKNADTNGMPAPVSPGIYDLRAVEAWHHARKGT